MTFMHFDSTVHSVSFVFYTFYVNVFVGLRFLALIGYVGVRGGLIVKVMIREAYYTLRNHVI